jgi:hypothetical protein
MQFLNGYAEREKKKLLKRMYMKKLGREEETRVVSYSFYLRIPFIVFSRYTNYSLLKTTFFSCKSIIMLCVF